MRIFENRPESLKHLDTPVRYGLDIANMLRPEAVKMRKSSGKSGPNRRYLAISRTFFRPFVSVFHTFFLLEERVCPGELLFPLRPGKC